ncbi:hypothetical protein SAMN05428996_2865 [Quadrisphaera sp. DSM 44207]|nr:hypothetical protein SAMN05428996_2865 [Quadrisphaera sp. DSM 44207]
MTQRLGAVKLAWRPGADRYRGDMEPRRRLDDDELAEEIELYGDLVVAASEADEALPQEEIDRLLGIRRD